MKEIIIQIRKARDLSQAELGEMCDLSPSYIPHTEKGRMTNPSLKTFQKIAQGTGFPATLLFASFDDPLLDDGDKAVISAMISKYMERQNGAT